MNRQITTNKLGVRDFKYTSMLVLVGMVLVGIGIGSAFASWIDNKLDSMPTPVIVEAVAPVVSIQPDDIIVLKGDDERHELYVYEMGGDWVKARVWTSAGWSRSVYSRAECIRVRKWEPKDNQPK
jgi:hypothetical protein